MFVICNETEGLWLCATDPNEWTEDVDEALTWDTSEAATAAAEAAGICTCWVKAK
jgi:hypothetical protein